ncbi:MAG TPA: D-alanine--D-alanine ligase [Geobacteraceae bacterium]|nr:D-alanine--D-alanine ligase [Geobacteraceae bacterium]
MTREELKTKKIGVLMGGLSAEREVSLASGAAVLKALLEQGYDAVAIDMGRDLAGVLAKEAVEVAFICLHGRYGEDGAVQGLLEVMGIPYTGAGVLASALAMNKIFAKKLFQASALTIAPYRVVKRGEKFDPATLGFSLPVVAKPSQEGSSVGVTIVRRPEDMDKALEAAFAYDDEALVEQFIKGREIQVGILEERALGAIEIVPKKEFYDYEAKYTDGMAEHIYPAPLNPVLYRKVLEAGEQAHGALGCCGYSRVDFLVTDDEECFLLEVNTLPGMTALSLLPEIARGAGISFSQLVERILATAALKIRV